MNHAMLPQNNGSSQANELAQTNGAASPQAWLKQTVQQFFSSVNWDDQPPEIQHLRLANAQAEPQSLSRFLTVSQFFNSFNWVGDSSVSTASPSQFLVEPVADTNNVFTLDDFSDLF